jgi:ubiquinone/menaquinone biosynthesis C-methylase UbiE
MTSEVTDYYALNQRVYPKLAPFYDVVASPLGRLRERVATLAAVGPGSHVLDVATGTGAQALAFAERGADVVGIDISEAMLAVARKKRQALNIRYEIGDATALPFPDATFDACCVSFALHEMPPSVREHAVGEMSRVTRPGGRVVVFDYALPKRPILARLAVGLVSLYERDHYAEFVRSDLRALLAQAGIDAREEERGLLGAVQIVIGEKRRGEVEP